MKKSDAEKIKVGDFVKIKNKSDIGFTGGFWDSCGGKKFEVIKIHKTGDRFKLDFRDVYTPEKSGFVNIRAIDKVCNVNYFCLQDDLFQL